MPDTLTEAQQERERARETLEQAARRGQGPDSFKRQDVLWAVRGNATEIDRLAAIADQAREEQRARERAVSDRVRFTALVDSIIAEMDAEALAEKRKIAEAEALKRLGLEAKP